MRPARIFVVLTLTASVAACSGGSSAPATASAATTVAPAPSSAAPAASTAGASQGGSSGGALGGAVQPGGQLCGLLGPADFAAQGITGAAAPSVNGDGTTEAYCVYAGTSSATGGIEFDAFTGDAQATYQNVIASSNAGATATDAKSKLAGVDAAQINLKDEGGSATIAVRAGNLVFDIGFPASGKAEAQLIALAQLVLQRGAALR